MDFVTLVLTFPQIVEGIVKTCRTIHDYQNLQENHKLAVDRAVFGCRKLAYYVSFIDVRRDPFPGEEQLRFLLEESVFHASDAMVTMALVVEDWSIRLHVETHRSGRVLMARLATELAEKLTRKYKNLTLSSFGRSAVGKVASEVAYLAMGCRQINDAMTALEGWTGNLRDILLSSQELRNVRDPINHVDVTSMKDVVDDVLIVTRCRRRVEEKHPVQRIEASEINLYEDLDPAYPTGFYMIMKGRYMGCIIDRRDMNHLYSVEKDDQAVWETDNIARLFAEERSGTALAEPFASVGILPCCGWAKTSSRFMSTEHDLVFRPPPGSRQPRTLRMLLLNNSPRHSLEDRLRFSIQLATSVLLVHSLGLVHKDIRPDSILVFESLKAKENDLFPYKLGTPYLANFDRTRSDESDTEINPYRHSPYMRTIYTHPDHTTSDEHIRYHMRDDIYSLGVVLLEVAVWKSLFSWSKRGGCYDADFSWFDFSIDKYKKIFLEMGQPEFRNRGWLVQWDLIELAETEIPIVVGTKFKDVVVSCLMFGEESRPTLDQSVRKLEEAGYEPQNESVNFVRDILTKLRSLNLS